MKEQFIKLLQETNREGIENVISYLEQAGFFQAPASVGRHLSCEGGLLQHSLNVCRTAQMLRTQAINLRPELEQQLPADSIVIAALLHDICKANIYKTVQKWRKDENNRWEAYESYDTDYTRFPVGHGEKSVIMLLRLGLKLTNEEIIAIRWHMGAWNLPMHSYEDKQNISAALDNCPLAAIIQAADALATHLLETKNDGK